VDGRKQIALRIQEATTSDTIMGMFFNGALSYLERQLGTVAVVILQREVLGGEGIVTFFRYPVANLLRIVGRALDFQRGSSNDAAFLHGLGRAVAQWSLDAPIARAVAMIGKGNPNGLLASAPTAFMTLTSYGERKHAEKNARSATMTHKRDLMGPAFIAGLTEQTLESIAHVKAKASITPLNSSGSDFSLELNW
jgi:uncharacterized protein (TIGR02265 family)